MTKEDVTKLVQTMTGIADSMEALAECIRDCSASLMENAGAVRTDPPRKAPKEKPTKEDAVPAEEPEKEWSLEEVRMILADKSRAGHTEEVKTLISKYGAERLSDIKPADFAALMAEAEVIGNG
ncbi:MAG: rRNA biogenesis protein rrp5 [Lachnospiraceae bacterium]|nr:rRNA biogenesis protein rrp5 [Lachnospiraceae bacterium]